MPRRRHDDDDDDDDDDDSPVRTTTRNRKNEHRRHKEKDDDDEEEEKMQPVPMWKTVAVIVVVVGCFIAVYPKMFHPMLMYALGFNKPQTKEPEQDRYPHPGARHGVPPGRVPTADPNMQHGHHGPPPTMRMGPHHAGPVEAQKTSSKAMWHWMLPFYTIGVVIFLLYTLGKIFWKQPRRNRKDFNLRYNSNRNRFEVNRNNGENDDDGGGDSDEFDEDGRDRGTLNNRELRRLQGRLQETESAMHKILTQLEQLSGTVDQTTADNLKRMTLETLNNIGDLEQRKPREENFDRGERERKTKSSSRPSADDQNRPYIKDLEKALSDFKKFTENYIEEHTKKTQDATENPSSTDAKVSDDDERVESRGADDESEDENEATQFDRMENEDVNNLIVENGEGELINVENDDDDEEKDVKGDDSKIVKQLKKDESNRVRKRKPKSKANVE